MSDSTARLWQVIRQDDNGHRYRIGHCASQGDAERLLRRLGHGAPVRPRDAATYVVERVE